jgi:hypothetical protein
VSEAEIPGIAVPNAPVMLRQGDVLLIPADGIPAAARVVARDKGRVVLAYGEVTGHAHAIASRDATHLRDGDDRYLRLRATATLAHEEHAAIEVPPGVYRIVIQREYVPAPVPANAWRRVID